jgi:hypothetical protein
MSVFLVFIVHFQSALSEDNSPIQEHRKTVKIYFQLIENLEMGRDMAVTKLSLASLSAAV